MNRPELIAELKTYQTLFEEERRFIPMFIDLLENHTNCFERSLLSGHITGSAWVLNDSFTKALFVHHTKLNRWLQPGGHADGNEDLRYVAEKELIEETGLTVKPHRTIFDLDIHIIPARKDVPEHNHFDIRFYFIANERDQLELSEESSEVKWWELNDVPKLISEDQSIIRMVAKSKLLTK